MVHNNFRSYILHGMLSLTYSAFHCEVRSYSGIDDWSKSLSKLDKTNEIPTAQQILKSMENMEGSIVTFDAIHTQEETARIVVMEKKADYVLVVKDNQKALKKTSR